MKIKVKKVGTKAAIVPGLRPYYIRENIRIYHGDCLRVLRDISPSQFNCIFTDPPYGIKLRTDYTARYRGPGHAVCNAYAPVHGDDEPFRPSWIFQLVGTIRYIVLWGANYYCHHLFGTSGWLVWDKRRCVSRDQADCELAWTNFIKGVRIFRHRWDGFIRASEKGENYHPTQKPVALWNWVLNLKWTPKTGTILDPYCGSGPLLLAAIGNDRSAAGIEISERYCEIAAKRCDAAFDSKGMLFPLPPPRRELAD